MKYEKAMARAGRALRNMMVPMVHPRRGSNYQKPTRKNSRLILELMANVSEQLSEQNPELKDELEKAASCLDDARDKL